MPSDPPPSASAGRQGFLTTQWSEVLRAGDANSPGCQRALEDLCAAYWPPLYAYVRRRGAAPAEAQDAVQEFIVLLLRREDLSRVSPERGRFRTFLLTALNHFLVSRVRAESALKRGGHLKAVSIDGTDAEALCAPELADPLTPDKAFDRRWARTVMARSLGRLRDEHREPRQARLFAALEPSLSEGGRVRDQAALATELGLSPGALAVAATRLRQRYRALIETEVRQTLANPADLAEEMRALRTAWAS
jgi:RNA polymerase sigma-70 factor (ECF subfamily)